MDKILVWIVALLVAACIATSSFAGGRSAPGISPLGGPCIPEERLAGGGATMMMVGGTAAAGGCTASYGAELLTTENATAPAGVTEADATTGWSANGTPTWSSSEAAPSLGTSHLNIVADANAEVVYQTLTGLSGSTIYKYSFDVRHNGTGGAWLCGVGKSYLELYDSSFTTITSADNTYRNFGRLFLFNAYADTLGCVENSGTNDGGVFLDNVSVRAATPCLGTELYTLANAANIASESNATTGWTAINSGTVSSVSTGTPNNGTYHILIDNTAGNTANQGANLDLASAPFSMETGKRYLVRFFAKVVDSNAWYCGFSASSTGTVTATTPQIATTTSYVEYGFDITYAASPYRYFVCNELNAGNSGGVYIDAFSVKEILSD